MTIGCSLIGLACAVALAEFGASVTIAARRLKKLKDLSNLMTKKGLLVALSIVESGDRESMMNEFFAGEYYDTEEVPVQEIIIKLQKNAPRFTFSLFEKYTKAYCDGKIPDLLPFNIVNLKMSSDKESDIEMELLEGFSNMPNEDREDTLKFLKEID